MGLRASNFGFRGDGFALLIGETSPQSYEPRANPINPT